MTYVDGNAIAGLLREVFDEELTAAVSTCGTCGEVAVVAELRVYLRCPGAVVRCPRCGAVLVRIAEIRGLHVVDLGGLRDLARA